MKLEHNHFFTRPKNINTVELILIWLFTVCSLRMEVGWHANIYEFYNVRGSYMTIHYLWVLERRKRERGRDGVRATRYINMNGKLYWKILFLSCFRCGRADFIRLLAVCSVAWSSCQMHQFSTVGMNSHSLTHSIYLHIFFFQKCVPFPEPYSIFISRLKNY